MAKFRIKLHIQGFDLEVEGSREDIPLIAQNIGQQVSGLLEPAANIVEGEIVQRDAPAAARSSEIESKPRRRRSRKSGAARSDSAGEEKQLTWQHDPEKWGNPLQEWKTAEKALWLLYVVEEATGHRSDLNAYRIQQTFNDSFRTAGTIRRGNIDRDLGKLKGATPPVVGQPVGESSWFLTQEGKKRATALISAALGKPA